MRGSATLALSAACVILGACGRDTGNGAADGSDADNGAAIGRAADTTALSADNRASAAASEGTAGDSADAGHAGHAAAPGEGALLLPIMQKLGADVMGLTHALMTENRQQVATTAHAIAEHAPIAAEDLERIHRELGDDMAEFERLDEAVHQSSMRLHDAAADRPFEEVLERLGEVQRGCIACHVQFRERLRTNPDR